MKKSKTDYDQTLEKVERLIEMIQRGDMGLEEMRGEVRNALAMIEGCKAKLRDIQADLEEVLSEEE